MRVSFIRYLLLYASFAAPLVLPHSQATANPVGERVALGDVSFERSNAGLDVIQRSGRAIIEWSDFSIGEGETTRFRQPSAASVALNRVTGPNASLIAGELLANGTVFLVNRNGILFDSQARVDVGGLLATTNDIANDAFRAATETFPYGPFSFSEPGQAEATVVNRGEIFVRGGFAADGAGIAALVAPGVRNDGMIVANLGHAVLASGGDFTLDLYGDRLFEFEVGERLEKTLASQGVASTGTIAANGGRVLITADLAANTVDSVLNMGGVVEARTALISGELRDGEVVLSARNGLLRVGESGAASTRVDGSTVALDSGGSVEVVGQTTLTAGSGGVSIGKRGGVPQSVTLGAGAAIVSTPGGVQIDADGDVQLSSVLTSGDLEVLSNSGSITVTDPLVGFSAPSGTTQTGSVSLTAPDGVVALPAIDSAGFVSTAAPVTKVGATIFAEDGVSFGNSLDGGQTFGATEVEASIFTAGGSIVFNGGVTFRPGPDAPRATSTQQDGRPVFTTEQISLATTGDGAFTSAASASGEIQFLGTVQTSGADLVQLDLDAGRQGAVRFADVDSRLPFGALESFGDQRTDAATLKINMLETGQVSTSGTLVVEKFQVVAPGTTAEAARPVSSTSTTDFGGTPTFGDTPTTEFVSADDATPLDFSVFAQTHIIDLPPQGTEDSTSAGPGMGPIQNTVQAGAVATKRVLGEFSRPPGSPLSPVSLQSPNTIDNVNGSPETPQRESGSDTAVTATLTKQATEEASEEEIHASDSEAEDNDSLATNSCGAGAWVYASSPGEAAFSRDRTGAAYSVDPFCGTYSLVAEDDDSDRAYAGLTYLRGGFWSDWLQAQTLNPGAQIQADYRILPGVASDANRSSNR